MFRDEILRHVQVLIPNKFVHAVSFCRMVSVYVTQFDFQKNHTKFRALFGVIMAIITNGNWTNVAITSSLVGKKPP